MNAHNFKTNLYKKALDISKYVNNRSKIYVFQSISSILDICFGIENILAFYFIFFQKYFYLYSVTKSKD